MEQLERTLLQSPVDSQLQFRLEDVWRPMARGREPQYALLVFLRRFGCPICRATTSGLAHLLKQVIDKQLQGRCRVTAVACESVGVQEFMRLGYARNTLSTDITEHQIQLYVNPNGTAFKLLNLKKLQLTNAYGAADVRKTSAALALAGDDYYRKTFDFRGNYAQLGGMYVIRFK